MGSGLLRLLLLAVGLLFVLPRADVRAETLRSFPVMLVAAADYVGDRSDSAVLAEIDQVLLVANRYLAPLGLRVVLTGVQLERGLGSHYTLGASGGPETLLQFIKLEWSERPLPSRAAVVVLLRNAPGGVSGLSFSSTACLNPSSAVLYAASGSGEQATLRLGATVAHEIGHLLGMEHDAKLYSSGVSLMWPQVAAFANGFSPTSLHQFASYGERGGLSCLPVEVEGGTQQLLTEGGATELRFVGGAKQELSVNEGSELRFAVKLSSDEPGAAFWAEGLPTGAEFDPLSGELSFKPSFSTVSGGARERSFLSTFSARTAVGAGAMTLQIVVRDLNRPPHFTDATAASIAAAPGERVSFAVLGADLDGDSVQLRYRVLSRSLRSDALKARCVRARCDFTFSPRGRRTGEMLIEVTARDTLGATTRRTVSVQSVEGGSARAVLQLPSELTAVQGSGTPLVFSLSGPPAELDIAALPMGWAVRREGGRALSIYALGGTAKSGAARIELLVREQGVERKVPVTINAYSGGIGRPAEIWPGSVAEPRARVGVEGGEVGSILYDYSYGRWRGVGCDGAVSGASAQFGGLIGDLPLMMFVNRQAHRAVFRVNGEQGWWLIDREGGIDSIPWGLKRDVPIVGDFDGDGHSDPAVFRPSENSFYLMLSGGGSRVVAMPALKQQAGLLREPFAADWDGDGVDDLIVVMRVDGGLLAQVLSSKGGSEFRVAIASETRSDPLQPLIADLDNDGRAELGAAVPGKRFLFASSLRGAVHELALPPGVAAEPFVTECAAPDGARNARLFLLDRIRGIALRFEALGGVIPAVSSDLSLFTEMFSNAPQSFRPLGSFQAARARSSALPSFGALIGAASAPIVTRRNGSRMEWLLQAGSGVESIPVASDTATFRSAGAFAAARLISFSDGLWESVGRGGDRERALWGTIGDLPVPGDYNGDGLTDLAIFRSSDRSWWVRFSGANGPTLDTRVAIWGAAGDQPVPGDYDGDGASDFAVYRRSGGELLGGVKEEGGAVWLIQFADGRVAVERLGAGNDTPVPADYDGDGTTDLAVWRPQSGEWLVRLESGVHRVQWGLSGDEPVRGDFDGDGRADLVVWRPTSGVWFSKPFDRGPTAATSTQFGLPGDEPLGIYRTLRIY